MGAFDALKKVKDIGGNLVTKIFGAIAGIFTGFAKGFADGRKFGAEMSTSVSEIKTLTSSTVIVPTESKQ